MLPTEIVKSLGQMSDAASAAFPDADFIVAFKVAPPDDPSNPKDLSNVDANVYVKKGMTWAVTDLQNMATTPAGLQIAPKNNQLLQLNLPNGQTSFCVSTPRWYWT